MTFFDEPPEYSGGLVVSACASGFAGSPHFAYHGETCSAKLQGVWQRRRSRSYLTELVVLFS